MTLVKYNGNFPDLLDDFFGKDMDGMFSWPAGSPIRHAVPAVNMREDDTHFHWEVAAPGLKKDDFSITLDDDVLTVRIEQRQQNEETGDVSNYIKREFRYQSFTRSFQLPEECNSNRIQASYENGVLHISVQKRRIKRKSPRQIRIS